MAPKTGDPYYQRGPQRNTEARAAMLAARREAQLQRESGRFTPSPRKRPRMSRRGEQTQSWRTKAWTPHRKDRFVADGGLLPVSVR